MASYQVPPPAAQYAPRNCSWCGVAVLDPTRQACPNCAGPLPAPRLIAMPVQGMMPAQRSLGPIPPPPPRRLPKQYVNRVLYWGNTITIIGMFFTIFFFWTIIFAIIGIPMWIAGVNRGKRELRALELGWAVEGRIASATQDTSETMNGRHPWKITYAFATQRGQQRVEEDRGWDQENAFFRPGDPAWVVYMDDEPGVSAIWPPVR